MYSPRPISFPAHWCAGYSKYLGFLAGGISNASSPLLFWDRSSAAKTLISQYRQLRRLHEYLYPILLFLLPRLSNHPDLGGILPVVLENPKSRPICDKNCTKYKIKLSTCFKASRHPNLLGEHTPRPSSCTCLWHSCDSLVVHASLLSKLLASVLWVLSSNLFLV